MSKHEYRVIVQAHLDDTFSVLESTIKGLWLETESVREMLDEIVRVGARLLQSNCGLTDAQLNHAVITVAFQLEVPTSRGKTRPKLRYEEPMAAVW